jgi:hypothetical protein
VSNCRDSSGKLRAPGLDTVALDSERLSAKSLAALRGIVARQPATETAGRIAIWLLVEDPEFARRAECWSARVAEDLRAMPPLMKRQWRSMLLDADLCNDDRPGRDWMNRVRVKIEAMGRDEFARLLTKWLNFIPVAAYGKRSPRVAVTRLGSHLLKSLVWWSTLCGCPELDDAVVRLAGAKWRGKARERRIAGAVAFAVSQMHEATQIPGCVAPQPVMQYLPPLV